MLRQPESRYEVGRSLTLLKVKSFHDAEAQVLEQLKGAGRHKGRLGALLVELAGGTRFSVGTGFSDAEREAPPPVGSVITFRYQELSDGGVPRFPSFVRMRGDAVGPATPTTIPQRTPGPGSGSERSAPSQTPRRFELIEGSSSKFWEVARDGCAVTVPPWPDRKRWPSQDQRVRKRRVGPAPRRRTDRGEGRQGISRTQPDVVSAPQRKDVRFACDRDIAARPAAAARHEILNLKQSSTRRGVSVRRGVLGSWASRFSRRSHRRPNADFRQPSIFRIVVKGRLPITFWIRATSTAMKLLHDTSEWCSRPDFWPSWWTPGLAGELAQLLVEVCRDLRQDRRRHWRVVGIVLYDKTGRLLPPDPEANG